MSEQQTMSQKSERNDRPNVLLFMMDQLSARWLEAAQNGICQLENIEWLQEHGTNFSRCITSNPLCMPARATLATGLTTRQHGVLENGYQLDPSLPTFMEILQDAGYRTGCFGKLHFTPHYHSVRPDYKKYGFDETHITEDARGGEWLDWVEQEHPDYYDAVLATIWPTHLPAFENYGPEDRNLRERIEKLREEWSWGDCDYPASWHEYPLPFPKEISQTEWITGHAESFLRNMQENEPFFAQVSYVQPHGPFCPPGEYMERVNREMIPEPCPAEWRQDPAAPAALSQLARDDGIPENWRTVRQYYFADLIHLDEQLGRVRKALEKNGQLGNTYIVLLADHGEMMYDHGFQGKAGFHYDGCIRVPLIMAGPGLGHGQSCDALVQLEDVFPTIMDITGCTPPQPTAGGPFLDEKPETRQPGNSLLPWCRGKTPEDWRTAAYCESYNNIKSASYTRWARTVRTADTRYTYYPRGEGEQLFNLETDPGEQNNMVRDADATELRRKMRDELLDKIILQDYPHPERSLYMQGVH